MTWTLQFANDFERRVHIEDKQTAKEVLVKLHCLAHLDDPRARCKALTWPLSGLWRLRVGEYRVLLDIRRDEPVIVALSIGLSITIYDK